MKKQGKNRLTYRQAEIISFLIATICCIIFLISMILANRNLAEWIVFGVMEMAVLSGIYLISWTILENLAEQNPKEKERAISFLNKEEFTEINYVPSRKETTDEINMLLKVLKNCGCKFYAKLIGNDEIILIVKDNSNEVKYKTIISNYTYFNTIFEQKLY